MTPMQEQYNRIKADYPDNIVLFRLGDFFEAFDQDAIKISNILGITLTGRGKGLNRHPMAGIPHHALSNYLPKLVKAGLKVAIADQITEAVQGQLVERRVTKVVTAGTITDEKSLEINKNNFIASVFFDKKAKLFSGSFCDLTTGEFFVIENCSAQKIIDLIYSYEVSEVLVDSNLKSELNFSSNPRLIITPLEPLSFNFSQALKTLKEHFIVNTLKGFGVEDSSPAISPAGALIGYIKKCHRSALNHISKIIKVNLKNVMNLDNSTIRNLELVYPLNPESPKNSTLLSAIDKNKTPMGHRLLRSYLLRPLTSKAQLSKRYQSVLLYFKNPILTGDLRNVLSGMSDLERLIGKVGLGTATPKDLQSLLHNLLLAKSCLDLTLPHIKEDDATYQLVRLYDKNEVDFVINLIKERISDDPPANLADGGVIKQGYSKEIDAVRSIKTTSKSILNEIQLRESKRLNISNLKVSFNAVFGYFIEITKSHLDKVPSDYIRKQTLTNAERFITQELKELENKIINSESKVFELEKALFLETVALVTLRINSITVISKIVAHIDLYSSLAILAKENNYTKPEFSQNSLIIEKGRHPVVENLLFNKFIPNNTHLSKNSFVNILTGPNMAGKSTYIRQVATICLLSQIGSFVPASKFVTPVFDRIFTRVGASDNLAKGESTFMVEMTETANILNNASSNSLVILDEIGRGTSTYDGVAIAWSIIEYIYKNLKCFTLFATHYHELTQMSSIYPNITNFNVKVLEEGSNIKFLYAIEKGAANKSYGVHVAKLAGIPLGVTKRADEILQKYESKSSKVPNKPKSIHPEQLNLIN